MPVKVIGAGLAGCEAAWQLISAGVEVELMEMRPKVMTKAHQSGDFAELVCSNSLGGAALNNAPGLLKAELRRLGSLIMAAADHSAVPAGGALAVDRRRFSAFIEERLKSSPRLKFVNEQALDLPAASVAAPVIIASGPLTSPPLARAIREFVGHSGFAFFDAISPIVTYDSIDHSIVFRQSRYDKGGGADYLNVPLDREAYYAFVEGILSAEKFMPHSAADTAPDEDLKPFEGCMPIEDMAARGPDTLCFGPLKPVGLIDPQSGRRPFAVLQLRQDNQAGTLWNMVGMQTRMKRGEQERLFRSLPGLARAEFVRFGSVHRNSFINSPAMLNADLECRSRPGLFFAGQITGVEGYLESTAAGLAAGRNAARRADGKETLIFPPGTAIGSLLAYISDPERKDFQPMNTSFGLLPTAAVDPAAPKQKRLPKKERRIQAAEAALAALDHFMAELR